MVRPHTFSPAYFGFLRTSDTQAKVQGLRQKGDAEGAISFNPENGEQVQLAIKLAGVKRKRQMSEKQKAVAEAALRLALARKRGTAVPTEGTLAT